MTNNSLLFVVDPEKRVLVSNRRNMIGDFIPAEMLEILKVNDKMEYDGRYSIIQSKSIQYMGWTVVSIIPVDELTDDMAPIKRNGVIIGVAMTIILLTIGIIIITNITRPITAIINFMKTNSKNNLHRRIDTTETNEVGQLSVHINEMLEGIENMTRKIVMTQQSLYEVELVKKQAELTALQSQINPHFLYNTLDCIRSIAISYNATEIMRIVIAMSAIFRYSIKEGDIVNINDEINCIKYYLDIMQIRYCDKFNIKFNIDERLMSIKTIKFILQPIVENAMYHGLEQISKPGELKITGELIGEEICFEICDNGKGMEPETLAFLNEIINEDSTNQLLNGDKKGNIGLINVNRRIRNICGNKYGIRIFSKKGEGTTVQVRFPSLG